MKRAVVIGASSGLGQEVARLLLEQGYTLGVAARRIDRLEQLRALAPDRVIVQRIDVTASDATQALNELIEKLGGMDLLFYASGVGKQNMELEPDIEINTVLTNGLGFTSVIGEAFRYMAQHGGGHIAAISSIGHQGTGSSSLLLCHQGTARHLSSSLGATITHAWLRNQHHRLATRLCSHRPAWR